MTCIMSIFMDGLGGLSHGFVKLTGRLLLSCSTTATTTQMSMRLQFELVPYDVLNYVISPFLDARERVAFNQVNHPFERVYQKFPADYVTRTQMNTMKRAYNMMTDRIDQLQEMADHLLNHEMVHYTSFGDLRRELHNVEADLVAAYFKILSFIEGPHFVPVFKYDTGGKNSVSQTLGRMYEDVDLYDSISEEMKENLRTRCTEVQTYIMGIPFVREIAKPLIR